MLRRAARQNRRSRQVGSPVVGGCALRIYVSGPDVETYGVQPGSRNDVARKCLACADAPGTNSGRWVVDDVQPAARGLALREVPDAFERGRRAELRGVRLRVVIAFPGQPEERAVPAVVELGDHDFAAEAGAEGPVGLRRQRNARGVVEEVVGRPVGVADGAEEAAVVVVGPRLE